MHPIIIKNKLIDILNPENIGVDVIFVKFGYVLPKLLRKQDYSIMAPHLISLISPGTIVRPNFFLDFQNSAKGTSRVKSNPINTHMF